MAGDTQTGQQYLGEIVQATLDEGADFILICGDLTDAGADFEFQKWLDIMQPLYDAGIGVYPVRGNHDSVDGGESNPKAVWDSVFFGDYALPGNGPSEQENVTYSFTHKTAFVIGLDQFTDLYRNHLDWLEEQFIANTQPHVFVFGHTAAFKLYHPDVIGLFAQERDIFVNRILAENGRVYFCGHDHFYDHMRLDDGDNDSNNDLHQFVVNSDSKIYNDWWYYGDTGNRLPVRISHQTAAGYLLVEIHDLDVTLIWKYRAGGYPYQSGDTFQYTAAEVQSPPVHIPDVYLKTAISGHLAVSEPNIMDMLALRVLDANSLGIFDLSGLEYARNLEYVYLNNNLITVTPSLRYLKNLKTVHLNDNPLDRRFYCIDKPLLLENNPFLDIKCEANPVLNDDCVVCFPDSNLEDAVESDLGVSPVTLFDMQELFWLQSTAGKGITNLQGLEYADYGLIFELSDNQITGLNPLSGNENLVGLDLSNNRVSDISGLSNLTDFMWLDLADNQIKDIPSLTHMMNLETLWLDGNPLNSRSYCEYMPVLIANNPNGFVSYDSNPNPFTDNCSTDMAELIAFLSNWLEVNCNPDNNWCEGADLNHVNDVDLADFAEMSIYWFGEN